MEPQLYYCRFLYFLFCVWNFQSTIQNLIGKCKANIGITWKAVFCKKDEEYKYDIIKLYSRTIWNHLGAWATGNSLTGVPYRYLTCISLKGCICLICTSSDTRLIFILPSVLKYEIFQNSPLLYITIWKKLKLSSQTHVKGKKQEIV